LKSILEITEECIKLLGDRKPSNGFREKEKPRGDDNFAMKSLRVDYVTALKEVRRDNLGGHKLRPLSPDQLVLRYIRPYEQSVPLDRYYSDQ